MNDRIAIVLLDLQDEGLITPDHFIRKVPDRQAWRISFRVVGGSACCVLLEIWETDQDHRVMVGPDTLGVAYVDDHRVYLGRRRLEWMVGLRDYIRDALAPSSQPLTPSPLSRYERLLSEDDPAQ